jgi:hypothetical protein
LVQSEVDYVDFAVITFVRVFYPTLYRQIARSKDELVPTLTYQMKTAMRDDNKDAIRQRWTDIVSREIDDPTESAGLLQLLQRMFPNLSSGALSNAHTSFHDADLRRGIASPEYFDRYFHFGVPPSDVSDARINSVINSTTAAKIDQSVAALVELIDGNPELAIDKVSRHIQHSSLDDCLLLELLLGVEPATPHSGLLGRTRIVLRATAGHLIDRMAEVEGRDVVECLRQAAADGSDFVIEVIAGLVKDKRGRGESTTSNFDSLAPYAIEQLKYALESRATQLASQVTNLLSMLNFWSILEPKAACGPWLWGKIDDPKSPWNLADVLGLMVTIYSSGGFFPDQSVGELQFGFVEDCLVSGG